MSYSEFDDSGFPVPIPVPSSAGSRGGEMQGRAPGCPDCGGPMWDNRQTKRKPTQPDYKCKNKGCDGAIWLDRKKGGQAPARAAAPQQEPVSYGSFPGDPAPAAPAAQAAHQPSGAGPVAQSGNAEARRAFLQRHRACFEYILEHYVPIVEKRNSNALQNSSEDMIQIDLKGIAALTYQILRGQEDAR